MRASALFPPSSASRRALLLLVGGLALSAVACTGHPATDGPIIGTSSQYDVRGEFHRIDVDSVERLRLDGSMLVVQGLERSQSVPLPPTADPAQRNRGWALVTDTVQDRHRLLTFTQEMAVEDVTLHVPLSEAPVQSGSLGGRDGHDVIVLAWGAAPDAYWGYVTLTRKPAAQD